MGDPDTRTLTRPAADPADYRQDFHAWALAQAAALRRLEARGLDDGVDWPNLLEEVEGLARQEQAAARSAMQRVIEHLLKLEHSPAAYPRRGWMNSVAEHRDRIEEVLEDSPSIRPLLPALASAAWPRARRAAGRGLQDDGLGPDDLPTDCPYTVDQILDHGWWPDRRQPK